MSPRSINADDGRNIVIVNGNPQGFICDAKVDPYTSRVWVVISGGVLDVYGFLIQIEAWCDLGKISQDNRVSKVSISPSLIRQLYHPESVGAPAIESYLDFTTMNRVYEPGVVGLYAPPTSTILASRKSEDNPTGVEDPGIEVPYPKGYRPAGDTTHETFGSQPWDLDDWADTRKIILEEYRYAHFVPGSPREQYIYSYTTSGREIWEFDLLQARYVTPAVTPTNAISAPQNASCQDGDWLNPFARSGWIYFYEDECACKRIKLWFDYWEVPTTTTVLSDIHNQTLSIKVTDHVCVKAHYKLTPP